MSPLPKYQAWAYLVVLWLLFSLVFYVIIHFVVKFW